MVKTMHNGASSYNINKIVLYEEDRVEDQTRASINKILYDDS